MNYRAMAGLPIIEDKHVSVIDTARAFLRGAKQSAFAKPYASKYAKPVREQNGPYESDRKYVVEGPTHRRGTRPVGRVIRRVNEDGTPIQRLGKKAKKAAKRARVRARRTA